MSGSNQLAWLVLTFAGSGASPKAPGTMGSLAATVVVDLLWGVGMRDPWLLPVLAFSMALAHLAVGDRIVTVFGEHDPGAVVSDEVVGQWLALAVIPLSAPLGGPDGFAGGIVLPLLLGFALFRVFDIAKVLGVARLERLPGKWGVLLDDVLAGIYAALVLGALAFTGVLATLQGWVGF